MTASRAFLHSTLVSNATTIDDDDNDLALLLLIKSSYHLLLNADTPGVQMGCAAVSAASDVVVVEVVDISAHASLFSCDTIASAALTPLRNAPRTLLRI